MLELPASVCCLLPVFLPPSPSEAASQECWKGLLVTQQASLNWLLVPAKSAGPAGRCWCIRLQVVTLQHLDRACALSPMMRSPGRLGREGGEGLCMNAVVCLVVLQSFSLAVDLA